MCPLNGGKNISNYAMTEIGWEVQVASPMNL